MRSKIISLFLVVCLLTIIPVKSYSKDIGQDGILQLKLEDAYIKSLNKSEQIAKNERDLFVLTKPYGAAKMIQNRNQYNMEEQFGRLYEKLNSGEFLQSYEQGELVMYYSIFKNTNIFLNKQLSPQIYPDEFPNCDVWIPMMQIRIANELVRIRTIDAVKQLFDSILSLDDQIGILEELNKVSDFENKEAIKNYESGSISKSDKVIINKNHESNKLELLKLRRLKENSLRQLKNITGLSLNQNVQVVPYFITDQDIEIPKYEDSLEKALINRNEIALSKMNLLATEIQLKAIKEYAILLPDSEEIQMKKQEAIMRVEELQNEIAENKNNVLIDINKLYGNVEYQKNILDIEKSNFESAEKNKNSSTIKYKNGSLSKIDLAKIEIEYMRSKATFEKAKRDLVYSISKLKTACGLG